MGEGDGEGTAAASNARPALGLAKPPAILLGAGEHDATTINTNANAIDLGV